MPNKMALPRRLMPALPEVRPLSDLLPGFRIISWFGLFAPTGMPPAVLARVNEVVSMTLAEPAFRARVTADGTTALTIAPDQLRAFVEGEARFWAEAIRISGAQVD